MFGISPAPGGAAAPSDPAPAWQDAEIALLSRFCVVDRWTANLHNAMLTLGTEACRFHGLGNATGRFGLLEFVRCYDQRVAREIIGVFEEAAARGRPLHYSAELRGSDERSRVVHCFGDYRPVSGDEGGDELFGIFLFSRDAFVAP